MNFLIKWGLCLCVWLSFNAVQAQSNPGYLGKTQVVEVSTTAYIPGILAHGPWINNHVSVSLEKAVSKRFSWRGGVRVGSGEFDGAEHIDYFYVSKDEPSGGYQSTNPAGGTLGYSLTEFFVAPRWYNNNSGAIAPFGNFYGLELAYAKVGIDDKIVWGGQAYKPAAVTEGFSTLSLAIQWGHRRVIFDNLCWDYHMGIGFNLFNTGNANVAYFEDGTPYDDHEAVVHSMVLQPLAWGRIFHGGVGLSYLF
jgi:hypothetical protein